MTLTEMAKQLDVTTMTVYRRLKRAGVDVRSLRDADTGELTAEGVAVIGGLFDTTGTTNAQHDTITQTQPDVQPDAQPADVEVAVLRVKLEAAEATVQRLDAEASRLRAQVDTLTVMLQTEQAERVRLLSAGHQHRGLFSWLRRGRGE